MIHVIENGTIPDLRPHEVEYALQLIQQFRVLPPIISVEQARVVQQQQQEQQLHERQAEEISLQRFEKKTKKKRLLKHKRPR